jgi:hypothetical protein
MLRATQVVFVAWVIGMYWIEWPVLLELLVDAKREWLRD